MIADLLERNNFTISSLFVVGEVVFYDFFMSAMILLIIRNIFYDMKGRVPFLYLFVEFLL